MGKVDRYLFICVIVDVFFILLISMCVLCSVEVNNLSVMLYFMKFFFIVFFIELVEEVLFLIYLLYKNNYF